MHAARISGILSADAQNGSYAERQSLVDYLLNLNGVVDLGTINTLRFRLREIVSEVPVNGCYLVERMVGFTRQPNEELIRLYLGGREVLVHENLFQNRIPLAVDPQAPFSLSLVPSVGANGINGVYTLIEPKHP